MSKASHQGLIVLGAPRSGTTLLRRLLDAHPAIACPGETFLLKATAGFLQADTIGHGIDYGPLGGLQAAGFSEEAVLGRLRRLCFGFMEEVAERAGKPRWAMKTAVDSFYLEEIERVYGGHAYFLCIVRHGLDVISSMKEFSDEMQGYVSELHRYVQRYPRPLEAFAHAWVDVTEGLRGLARRHPGDAILIRYEDLVAEPEATLRAILALVGEPWDERMLKAPFDSAKVDGIGDWKAYKRGAIDGSSVQRWRDLPPSAVDQIAGIVGPTLQACGYQPLEATPDDENKRKQELAMMVMASARKGEQ